MKRFATLALLASATILGFSASANAVPSLNGSFCEPGPAGFDCQIFEGGEDIGEWTQIQLPNDTSDGYIVLLEIDNGNHDPSNWSDVAWWHDGQDVTGAPIQLLDFFSDPLDSALFSVFVESFRAEDPSGVTLYDVGNRYFFHSDADEVPEPASLAIIAIGLLSLLGFGAWRRRADV